jgi:hypothetical protein
MNPRVSKPLDFKNIAYHSTFFKRKMNKNDVADKRVTQGFSPDASALKR